MKKTLLLFLFVFYIAFCYAGGWEKTFGTKGYFVSYGYKVIQDKSKNLLAVGNIDKGIVLVKVTLEGDTIFTKTFSSGGKDEALDLVETSAGNYLLVGRTSNFIEGFDQDIIVINVSAEGNLLWQKTYGADGRDNAASVVETTDGFLLSGTSQQLGAEANYVYVVKIDKSGKLLWTKAYGDGNFFGGDIVDDGTGSFYITGEDAVQRRTLLIKIDSNGRLIFSRSFGDKFWSFGVEIKQTPEKDLIIVGAASGTTHFAKVGPDGFVKWVKEYDKLSWGSCVTITKDNEYVLGATSSAGNATLIRTDVNGEVLWGQEYGSFKELRHSSVSSIVQTSDGTYSFTGGRDYDYLYAPDLYLVKTDSLGKTDCSGDIIVRSKTVEFNSSGAMMNEYTWGWEKDQIKSFQSVKLKSENICCPVKTQIVGKSSICKGNPLTLEAKGGHNYYWSTGDSTAVVNITSDTTKNLWVADKACLSSKASFKLTIFPYPEKPQITDVANLLISSTSEGNQWFFENAHIDTINIQVLKYSKQGRYSLCVTQNGCASDTTYYFATLSGLNDKPSLNAISVFPNPFKDFIRIDFPIEKNEERAISIINMMGETIGKYRFNGESITISSEQLNVSAGHYFFKIETADSIIVRKIVKM